MSFIKLSKFSGTVPRTGATNLAPNQAQIARNTKLQSGEIRAWRNSTKVYTPSLVNIQTIYKFQGPLNQDPKWLTFQQDVNIVSGPVADTTDYRLYYTSSSFGPRKTNWVMATGYLGGSTYGADPYPNAYYEMGVPAPTGAPTLSASGGTSPTETRAYVYTFVNQFGSVLEESAPSPAATVTCNTSGSTVVVNGFSSPPAGNYNFQYKRIYRSVTGATTSTYQLVAQIPIAQTSYSDTLSVTALGATLTSLYYTPPPSTLQGIVSLPNGILAGFTGNQIWFCEPYLPHAWPSTYMLTTEFPIVGLGVFGSTLFVGTTKNPYLIDGTSPSAMSQTKLSILQPCVSKKSIVSDQFGVMYASPNGLVAIGPGSQDVISNSLYTRDEWQNLTPNFIVGTLYNNMYLAFYPQANKYKAVAIIRNDNPPLIDLDIDATAVFVEHLTGSVFFLSQADNKIYQLDADLVNNVPFEWRSKKFVLPEPTNFGAVKVQGDFTYMFDATAYQQIYAQIVAANQALFGTGKLYGSLSQNTLDQYSINGSILQDLPTLASNRYITLTIYGDGQVLTTVDVNNQEPIRLPAGYKAYVYEVGIVGNSPVREVTLATTVGELRQVE